MSHDQEQYVARDDAARSGALRDGAASRPGFDLALRGYDRRQVDLYVSRRDSEIGTLVADQQRARGRSQHLAGELEQVQAELTELRLRPPQLDRATFRDLGPTVDQILALAEHQAQTITDTAAQQAAEYQAEAEQVRAEARQRADQLRADSEAAQEQAQQEAQRINEQSAQQLEQARAEADRLMEAACVQAQQQLDGARAQTQQEVQARQQALIQLQGELDTAQQQLIGSRQELVTVERETGRLDRKSVV